MPEYRVLVDESITREYLVTADSNTDAISKVFDESCSERGRLLYGEVTAIEAKLNG